MMIMEGWFNKQLLHMTPDKWLLGGINSGYYAKYASPLLYETHPISETLLPDYVSFKVNSVFSNISTLDWLAPATGHDFAYDTDPSSQAPFYYNDGSTGPNNFDEFTLRNIEKEWVYGDLPDLELELTNSSSGGQFLYDIEGFHSDISSLIAPECSQYYSSKNNVKGQLSHAVTYRLPENAIDGVSLPIKLDYFSYNEKNRLQWELQQINYNGISVLTTGNTLRIDYPSYDLQNNLLVQNLDFECDNVLDLQYAFDIDGFGRLARIYTNFDNSQYEGNLICELKYDNNTGLLASKKYFNNCDANNKNNEIYNEAYSYDVRDRLLGSTGDLFVYEMAYDANVVSHNSISPFQSSNYNGNINGIKATYKFNNVTNSSLDLFSDPTLYGYNYDDMNRLIGADSHVWKTSEPLPFSSGDAGYSYDKAGNFRNLYRYGYNANGTGAELLETKFYTYGVAKNHLLGVFGSGASDNRKLYSE